MNRSILTLVLFIALRSLAQDICPNKFDIQTITKALEDDMIDTSIYPVEHSNIFLNHPIIPAHLDSHNFIIRKYDPEIPSGTHEEWELCDMNYKILYVDSGSNRLSRPVFFVHGLGGDKTTWNGSYDAFTTQFQHVPIKIDYSGNQGSFKNASLESHKEMVRALNDFDFNASTGLGYYPYALPFAIGHSQGGLVLRDLDMKYATGLGEPSLQGQRTFAGIITFGTPHSGALIARSQDQLSKLISDITTSYLLAIGTKTIDDIPMRFPLRMFIDKSTAIDKYSKLLEIVQNKVLPELISYSSEGKTDPITHQYYPNSPYLKDTLNAFFNPCTAYALFYGKEIDPIVWRVLYHIINPASSYHSFQCNNDDTLANIMLDKQRELSLLALQSKRDSECEKLPNRVCPCLWHRNALLYWIGKNRDCHDHLLAQETYDIYMDAEEQLVKANMRYKAAIGVFDYSEVTWDTVGYQKRITQIDTIVVFGGNSKSYVREIWQFAEAVTLDSVQMDPLSYRMIRRKTIHQQPSDGVVLCNSQKAFPNVPEQFKHELIDANGNGNQNHLQMRNSLATKHSLEMIYTADGSLIPEFFKLETW